MLDIDNPGKENVLFHYEGKKVIQTFPTPRDNKRIISK